MHRFLIGMNRWGTLVMHRRLYVCLKGCARVLRSPAPGSDNPPCCNASHWRRSALLTLHSSASPFFPLRHTGDGLACAREMRSVCAECIDVARAVSREIAHLVMRSRQTAVISMGYAILKGSITPIMLNYSRIRAKYHPTRSDAGGVVLVQSHTHSRTTFCPPGTPYRKLTATEKNYGWTT